MHLHTVWWVQRDRELLLGPSVREPRRVLLAQRVRRVRRGRDDGPFVQGHDERHGLLLESTDDDGLGRGRAVGVDDALLRELTRLRYAAKSGMV